MWHLITLSANCIETVLKTCHGFTSIRPFSDWSLAPWWTPYGTLQSLVCTQTWRKMGIKDRRYGCRESTRAKIFLKEMTWRPWGQTRTVPGSVEGIRYALEWAGLEYDYGMGSEDCLACFLTITCRSWKRGSTCTLFAGGIILKWMAHYPLSRSVRTSRPLSILFSETIGGWCPMLKLLLYESLIAWLLVRACIQVFLYSR